MWDEFAKLDGIEGVKLSAEAFDERIVAIHSLPVIFDVDFEEGIEVVGAHSAIFNVVSLQFLVLIQQLDQEISLACSRPLLFPV